MARIGRGQPREEGIEESRDEGTKGELKSQKVEKSKSYAEASDDQSPDRERAGPAGCPILVRALSRTNTVHADPGQGWGTEERT